MWIVSFSTVCRSYQISQHFFCIKIPWNQIIKYETEKWFHEIYFAMCFIWKIANILGCTPISISLTKQVFQRLIEMSVHSSQIVTFHLKISQTFNFVQMIKAKILYFISFTPLKLSKSLFWPILKGKICISFKIRHLNVSKVLFGFGWLYVQTFSLAKNIKVWKFKDFSVTQILCEFNFEMKTSKTTIFDNFSG